jgi:hypothetical protein
MQGGIMLKIIFSTATALFLSLSAHATDSKSMTLNLSGGEMHAQQDQYYSFDFGTTRVNWPVYRDLTLNSNGPGDLRVYQISIGGADFSAYHNCPSVMPPRTYCTLQVRFAPLFEGFRTGRMYVDTSAGLITIDFQGWGVR